MIERQLRVVLRADVNVGDQHTLLSAAEARGQRIAALSMVHVVVPAEIAQRPRPPEALAAEEKIRRWRDSDTRTRLELLRKFIKRFGG